MANSNSPAKKSPAKISTPDSRTSSIRRTPSLRRTDGHPKTTHYAPRITENNLDSYRAKSILDSPTDHDPAQKSKYHSGDQSRYESPPTSKKLDKLRVCSPSIKNHRISPARNSRAKSSPDSPLKKSATSSKLVNTSPNPHPHIHRLYQQQGNDVIFESPGKCDSTAKKYHKKDCSSSLRTDKLKTASHGGKHYLKDNKNDPSPCALKIENCESESPGKVCSRSVRTDKSAAVSHGSDRKHYGKDKNYAYPSQSALKFKTYEDSSVKIGVFWDYENSPVPKSGKPDVMANHIKLAVEKLGLKGPVYIHSYANVLCLSPEVRSVLHYTTTFIDCPPGKGEAVDKRIILDMSKWGMDNRPPSVIFLISGDGDYKNVLNDLRMRNFLILLACPSSFKRRLVHTAHMIWFWPCLVSRIFDPYDDAYKFIDDHYDDKQQSKKQKREGGGR